MFSFYNDLESLKQSDFQLKQNFKYQMVHPYRLYEEGKAIESMEQISATLVISTFYHGLPHGIALIKYTDPDNKKYSFKGVCAFHHGKLHNAPFTYVNENGFGHSFSKMKNGRPADGSYSTQFYSNGHMQHVDTVKSKTDVGGW